jgi:hypothetical protein
MPAVTGPIAKSSEPENKGGKVKQAYEKLGKKKDTERNGRKEGTR